MVNDPIGDFINRIKNAQAVRHSSVTVPYSKLKHAIAEKLASRGFVGAIAVHGKEPKEKTLEVTLVYRENGAPRIMDAQRVSKPGRRLYASAGEVRPVRQGTGMVLVSTSQGIMTDKEAREANMGGELLLKVW